VSGVELWFDAARLTLAAALVHYEIAGSTNYWYCSYGVFWRSSLYSISPEWADKPDDEALFAGKDVFTLEMLKTMKQVSGQIGGCSISSYI
jgi:hypothetical protein